MASVKVGDRWARLKCVQVARDTKMIEMPGGAEEWPYTRIRLECDCGNEVDIDKDDFRGRRAMRDCGCGLADRDGGSTIRPLSLPVGLWLAIREYADEEWSGNWSGAACELLREGLKAKKEPAEQ